jgi:NADPH-dependent 2,4-dienoyl-CoA reductase/sulfur reductase-like enzyme/Fe-S-cluster-containing hydrogenase component 2/bacterioferritin-associated ferredoxin
MKLGVEMSENRIKNHPILSIPHKEIITFYWNGKPLQALQGEMIASALIANGINVFGHHHKDGTAQGIFCANGQCAKCTVIANQIAVKSCMTEVKNNMFVKSAEGLPELPEITEKPNLQDIEEIETEVLIIGGGPAGLSAAIQIGKYNIPTILLDDKNVLGGKLVLQTHKFFGSQEDSYAGTRGIEIGDTLAQKVYNLASVSVWTNSTALFVFSDKKVGILKDGVYKIVTPKLVLNAAGAREKFLRFSGNTLAGIYGAGAFQTLVNRDLVKSSNRLFIIGGGNVGLIAGYHALQAGIEVVGLVEAMPKCGGYKVHADKLKRLGVPVYTSHTILSANGRETVESITIAQIDENFKPIAGTEKTFLCDTILVAVGLDPLAEFTQEALEAGLQVFAAGDALEIAEASSAMFNGKISGLLVAKEMGAPVEEIPQDWYDKAEVLKSHPGKILDYKLSETEEGVFPLIHCIQEIPCNPCTTVCPTESIFIKDNSLMGLPYYEGKCIGCGKCILICPGLAITLIDYRKDKDFPIVTLPYELSKENVVAGQKVSAVDMDGNFLDMVEIIGVDFKKSQRTALVKVKAPKEWAKKIVSFQVQESWVSQPLEKAILPDLNENEAMICLCERVTVSDVEKVIEQGITDLNQIKAITRAGMGPCGAKTCDVLIKQVLRQKGIKSENVIANTRRPVFVEAFLEKFADGGER